MLEINEVMTAVYKGIESKLTGFGFSPVFPADVKATDVPLQQREGGACRIDYSGDKGKLRLLFSDGKLILLLGEKDAADADDKEFKKLSTSLMLLDEYDERDVRSAVNELNDTLDDNFGVKALAKKNNKMPATVSKSAVKSGTLSYDPATLASRVVMLYPALKSAYKENVDTYGEFLGEDFFVHHANPLIMETIRRNDPKAMKKLFNQLSDIYENGTNEVQNLIAVTILGEIRNDAVVMKEIIPYLSDSMVEPVIAVNKILEKSKRARTRLENPPKYKPKKKKSFTAQALGQ
ncbi:MAG: hypothetical protein IJ766_06260 [Clostridia bacterium]|nr:hypothetical protein [Clostridia bacterium]